MGTRRVVAAVALAALLLTSGCIGFLTGSESLSFESEPVAVTDAATQETGYEEKRRLANTQERTFTVAGQDRTVKVTNHLAEYARSMGTVLSEQQVARFTVFSTPQVKIAGQAFNPVARLSNRQLVIQLQQQYDSLENVRLESNRTVTTLGTEAAVSKFRADATLASGESVEVFIHITKFEHEGDFVVAAAVHPTQVDGQEDVNRLIEGIDHPAPASDSES